MQICDDIQGEQCQLAVREKKISSARTIRPIGKFIQFIFTDDVHQLSHHQHVKCQATLIQHEHKSQVLTKLNMHTRVSKNCVVCNKNKTKINIAYRKDNRVILFLLLLNL